MAAPDCQSGKAIIWRNPWVSIFPKMAMLSTYCANGRAADWTGWLRDDNVFLIAPFLLLPAEK
jgi:hypothetical protein